MHTYAHRTRTRTHSPVSKLTKASRMQATPEGSTWATQSSAEAELELDALAQPSGVTAQSRTDAQAEGKAS